MKILGVDTTTWAGSIALVDEVRLIGLVGIDAAESHAERLMSSIDFMLNTLRVELRDLAGLSVSLGPGSFTGVRIGIGAVKGLAYSLQKPVAGVSTLKAMAFSIEAGTDLCPLIDAGRGEIYGCHYRRAGDELMQISKEVVDTPIHFLDSVDADSVLAFGTGAAKYKDQIEGMYRGRVKIIRFHQFIAPSVALLGLDLIREGKTSTIQPNYIRKSDAELKTGRRTTTRQG